MSLTREEKDAIHAARHGGALTKGRVAVNRANAARFAKARREKARVEAARRAAPPAVVPLALGDFSGFERRAAEIQDYEADFYRRRAEDREGEEA